MRRLSPVTAATLVALAGVAAGAALALLLVPLLSATVASTPLWRRWLLTVAALFGPCIVLWCRIALRPLLEPGADPAARRRAAHDFPFRVARLCFGAALGSGVATGAGLWLKHREEPAAALAAGVVTYLVLVLPIIAIYLGARQVLHREAAGPVGAGPVPGVRQSVRLRLALAVQFPVVVSMAGLVMVEQYNDIAYHHAQSRFYQEQYTQALSRVLLTLKDPADRAAAMRDLRPPPGIEPRTWPSPADGAASFGLLVDPDPERPLDTRLAPFLLLALVTACGALLGGWLAREVTGELGAATRALRALRQSALPAPIAPPAELSLRETGALVAALGEAVGAYQAREQAIREAAEARRRAEQAKSRFLAHLSHELKSPLNSILGFSEVLLAGLDGDLEPDQREKLAIIWRSGDMLLRYILALLDLARIEAGDGDARRLGFEPAPLSAGELEQCIRRQWRTDPLRVLCLELRNEAPDPDTPRTVVDPARTARAVVLAAGMLLDAVERGTAAVVCRVDEAGLLVVDVGLAAAHAEDADRRQLCEQLADGEDPAHLGAATTVMALLRSVAVAQGGALEVEAGHWPRLRFRFPPPARGCARS